MKPQSFIYLVIMFLTVPLTGCGVSSSAPTFAPNQLTKSSFKPVPFKNTTKPGPPLHADWQIQYSGELDLSLDVDVYNLDLFEVTPEVIETLHARGIYVMCYFSAGSWEEWRSDADRFPEKVIGKDYEGWPGERWLDVRDIQTLAPLLESRIQTAADKGCDGVDPDNVNGYENETGFPITNTGQLDFNLWLSQIAHNHNLDIGLKNDLGQINDLVAYFDWVLNEECFSYNECELLSPFYEADKPVFVIEYEMEPAEFCTQAKELGFNAIHKKWDLDMYRETCP